MLTRLIVSALLVAATLPAGADDTAPPAEVPAKAREALALYAESVRNTVIVLGSAGMKDRAQRREALAKLDPIRAEIRKQAPKEIVAEMDKLDAILEYLGRGLEDPVNGAPRHPDAKLNAQLGLQPNEFDERKMGRLAAQAIQAFAKAAGTSGR